MTGNNLVLFHFIYPPPKFATPNFPLEVHLNQISIILWPSPSKVCYTKLPLEVHFNKISIILGPFPPS